MPFVKKPKNSHGGEGVEMCRSIDDYDENMVCQKPASDLGKDVRVWVLGGENIASFIRISDTDFRSNYCLGGRAERYSLDEEERKKVKRILHHFSSSALGTVRLVRMWIFREAPASRSLARMWLLRLLPSPVGNKMTIRIRISGEVVLPALSSEIS